VTSNDDDFLRLMPCNKESHWGGTSNNGQGTDHIDVRVLWRDDVKEDDHCAGDLW
jgi:hypothetical protein